MSRSGYSYDCENHGLWRGAVERAIRGKRGQALLREMLLALDALPTKRLVADSLVNEEGGFCALGALGRHRALDMSELDANSPEMVGHAFGIACAMAAEIVYENDEVRLDLSVREETPEQRWIRMRAWVQSHIRVTP